MSTNTKKSQEKKEGTAKAASSSGTNTRTLQAGSGMSQTGFNNAVSAARAAYQQRTAGSTTQQSTGSGTAGGRSSGDTSNQYALKVGPVSYYVNPNNPTVNMTNQERALAFGMIMKDPSIVNRAYTRVGDAAAAAHTALQSGVTTPEALQQVRSSLDDLQTGITTLRTINAAMGAAGPENLQDIINRAQTSYNSMQSNYDSMTSRVSPMAKGVGTNLGLNPSVQQFTDPITQMTQRSGIGIPTVTPAAQRMTPAQQQAQAAAQERQRLLTMDVTAQRAEADRQDEIRQNASVIMGEQGSAAATAYLAQQGITINNMDDWNEFMEGKDETNAMRLDAAQAERLQTQTSMVTDATTAPDFAYWANKGAATENPTYDDLSRMWGTQKRREQSIGNIVEFSRANEETLRLAAANDGMMVGDLAYTYMTPDEVNVYNYYLGRDGKEQAQVYLDSIMDELNWRQAADRYQTIENMPGAISTIGKVGTGLEAGLSGFGDSVRAGIRMLKGDDSYTPGSVSAYLGGMAREGLEDTGPKILDRSLGQAAYDINQVTANMLPSILVSAVTGPLIGAAAGAAGAGAAAAAKIGTVGGQVLGGATVGFSAAGNAYEQMVNLGYDKDQSTVYATGIGILEGSLQTALGGIASLGGFIPEGITARVLQNVDNAMARTAIKLGSEFISEGFEEYLQDVLDPVVRNIAFGEHNKVDPTSEDAIYSGVLGGVSALLLGGGDVVTETMEQRRAGLQLQRAGVTAERLAEIGHTYPADSVAYRLADRIDRTTDAYTMARLFNEIGATLTDQNIADIQSALMDRGVTARDAQEIAMELAIAIENPGAMTEVQASVLSKCSVAADVINEVIMGDTALNTRNEAVRSIEADLRTAEENRTQTQENENAPAEERQGAEEFTDQTETGTEEEAEEDYTPAERLDRQILQREMDEVAEIAGQESGTDVMVQLNNKMQTLERDRNNALADMDIPAAEAYTRVMETVQRATEAAAAVDVSQGGDPVQLRADAMRDVINNEFGGYNYADQNTAGREEGQFGRAPGYDRAAGRNDHSPADVRGGEIQGVGDQDAIRGGDQEGRRGYGPAPEGTIQTSAKAIGIPKGTERALNYLPQAYHTEKQTRLRKEAESLGVNLDFVYGRIELSRDDGSTYEVDGIQYGNQVVVNCNSRRYTEGQLTIHELVHARARKDPGLVIEAVDRIRSRMTEESWKRMLSDYMRGSKMIYHQLEMERLGRDLTAEELDALDLKYAEEIVADAAAGITRLYSSGEGAAAYTEDVNALIREREGMGNGSGGMPGVRTEETHYSSADVEDEGYDTSGPHWALNRKIIGRADLAEFYRTIAEINAGRYNRRASDGSYIIERGRNIMFSDGNYQAPSLDRVIVVSEDMFADVGVQTIKELIIRGETGTQEDHDLSRRYVEDVYGPGSFLEYHVGDGATDARKERGSEGGYGQRDNGPLPRGESLLSYGAESETENDNGLHSEREGLTTRWDREAEEERARTERKARDERAPNLLESEESVNRPRYSIADEDMAEIGEREQEAAREATRAAEIEKMTPKELRRAVAEDREDVRSLRKFLERDIPAELKTQMQREIDGIESRLQAEEARLREHDQKVRQERAQAKERAKARQVPTQSRADLVQRTMDLFSIHEGRAALGNMMGAAFDDARSLGRFTEEARERLFSKFIDAGYVSAAADPYYQDIRRNIAGTRIYVPEGVRSEFGDRQSYTAFRRYAQSAGVTLTSDPTDLRIDGLHAELADAFPGAFDRTSTDETEMLRAMVDLAMEGKNENVSLPEMMQRVQDQEGWSVDDQVDHLKDQFDRIIDEAMYAAGIEVEQKTKSAMQIAKERTERRQAMERQASRRMMTEARDRAFRLLQWADRNKYRAGDPELRARMDEILENVNVITKTMADEAEYLDRYGATIGDVLKIYEAYKENNPNFLPSKDLDNLVMRTQAMAVGDMDLDTLEEITKNLLEIQQEIYNSKHMIDDDQHALVQDYYDRATREIESSKGRGKGRVAQVQNFADQMLTPMNYVEMIGGWHEGGAMHRMGKMLQDGERSQKAYIVGAQDILRDFRDRHTKWLTTADGQGKNGQWTKYEIPDYIPPENWQQMSGKPQYGEPVTVWVTPMMRVHLYLEMQNDQNMNHMQNGGRTFADKELYSKGKRSEAFAQGTTVRLSKEWAETICRDMTAEERELASLLQRYYNEYAPSQINPVSQKLVGYDKAVIDNYAPIQTNSNYNNSQPGLYDLTAAGVGVMKDRQFVAKNPSYNVGAIDAFERHMNQTSKYVGLAIPVSNFNRLMNWQDKENRTSFKDEISHKWGGEAVSTLEGFLTDIQNPQKGTDSKLGRIMDKTVSNYIGAVFAANPYIAIKQFASFPAAAVVLDGKIPSLAQVRNIDESLIQQYTPELAYRKLGQGVPEIAQMRNNPNWMDRHKLTRKWLRGGLIQDVDVFTVRTMWAWAENTVDKHNTGEDRVQKGTEEYYRKVAEVFNEAVNTTQPMYDFMNRAQIMNDKHAVTRTLTMFKTVPMQELNTMARFINEARNGDRSAKLKAAKSVASVIDSTLMLTAFGLLGDAMKNGLKGYRDDDDELTAQSVAQQFGLNALGNLIGIIPGASYLYEGILHGAGLSSYKNEFKLIGTEQITEIAKGLKTGGQLLADTVEGAWNVMENGGDVAAYFKRNAGDLRGGIKDLATMIAKYAGGWPQDNIEKLLGSFVARAGGRAVAAALGLKDPGAGWDIFWDTTTKDDLGYINEAELPARLDSLLAIRNIEADEGTSAELARLYLAGYKAAVPADTPDEIKDQDLSAYEMQEFDNAYTRFIGENLNSLVESDAYIDADDEERAEMLGMLYTYATQNASADIIDGYEFSSGNAWVGKANEAAQSGVDVVTYIQAKQAMDAAHEGSGNITQDEAAAALAGMDNLTNEQRDVLWHLANKGWKSDSPFATGYEPKDSGGTAAETPATVPAEIPAGTSGTAAQPVEEPEEEKPDPTDRKFIRSLYTDLKPPEGMDKVTQTQKYRAIIDAFDSVDDQVTALETEMSDTELEKIACGRSHAVTPDMYVTAKETMYAIDDEGDNDNSTSQAEAKYALDSMDDLTNEERAVLWQLTNKSWKPHVNPYDTEIGQLVYDEMHGNAPIGDPTDSGTGRRTSQPEMPQITWNVPEVSLPTYG